MVARVTQFLKRHMSFFRPRYLLGPNSSLSPPKKRFKNSSLFRSHISLIDLDLGAKLLHLVWKECTYIFPKISNVAFLEKMWKVKEKIFLYSSGVLMLIQKYIFTNVFHFVVKYLTCNCIYCLNNELTLYGVWASSSFKLSSSSMYQAKLFLEYFEFRLE